MEERSPIEVWTIYLVPPLFSSVVVIKSLGSVLKRRSNGHTKERKTTFLLPRSSSYCFSPPSTPLLLTALDRRRTRSLTPPPRPSPQSQDPWRWVRGGERALHNAHQLVKSVWRFLFVAFDSPQRQARGPDQTRPHRRGERCCSATHKIRIASSIKDFPLRKIEMPKELCRPHRELRPEPHYGAILFSAIVCFSHRPILVYY